MEKMASLAPKEIFNYAEKYLMNLKLSIIKKKMLDIYKKIIWLRIAQIKINEHILKKK